jgi:hypothetical protein
VLGEPAVRALSVQMVWDNLRCLGTEALARLSLGVKAYRTCDLKDQIARFVEHYNHSNAISA